MYCVTHTSQVSCYATYIIMIIYGKLSGFHVSVDLSLSSIFCCITRFDYPCAKTLSVQYIEYLDM